MKAVQNIEGLYKLGFGKSRINHLIFWVTFLILLMLIEGIDSGFFNTLRSEFLNIFFYALVVYTNLYYLIPKFLNKKKFLSYFLMMIILVLLVSPIKMLLLYFSFSGEQAAQNNLLHNQGLVFLSNFFVVGISTIYSIIGDWASQLQEKKEIETQNMQSELKFLRSQINPHFLFNTLNNLYALTLKKSDQAPEIVLKLSEMMRYMLYECNEPKVLLSKEINYIRNYLDLERIRQRDHVEIKFEKSGNISSQTIAPLLLITFIENCFKHGIKNSVTSGFVNLIINVTDDELIFIVENSKPSGFPYQEHKRPGGIGLVNVKRRLELLYSGKHELNIQDSPNSYRVELILNTQ